MNIYELTQQQKDLLDILFWEDDEDKQSAINDALAKIDCEITQKLAYLSDILAESRAITEAREEAKRSAERRFKSALNAEARLEELILETMKQFNIKKVSGKHKNVTLCQGKEAIVYPDDFDVMELPEDARKTTIETKPIYTAVLDLIKNDEIEGPYIVRNHYLFVN
jgi:hypothetical protein